MTGLSQFIINNHLSGLAIGLATFVVIGLFHPIVVKGEYYLGVKRCIPLFLTLGIVAAIISIVVDDSFWSPITGVIAFSALWSIKEVKEQVQRVNRGWFPRNPKRQSDTSDDTSTTKD